MFVDLSGRTRTTFTWTVVYLSNENSSFYFFLRHHAFRRDIKTLLFGDSQKDQSQNMLISKAVQTFIKHSRRINVIPTHVIYLISFIFSYTLNYHILIYYLSCSLSDLCLYDTGENLWDAKLVFNPIVYLTIKYV